MKLRIVSDGTPSGTHIYHPAGHELPGVTKIHVHAHADSPLVTAHVTFTGVELDLTAETDE